MQEYSSTMSEASINYEDIIKKMTGEVIEEIQKQIEAHVIDFGQQTVDVNPIIQRQETKRNKKKLSNKQQKEPTLQHLRQIKESKLIELKQIERQEVELKRQAILNSSKVSNSCFKMKRSNFTEEEMMEIKRIIKNKKKFQKELKKKEGDLQSWQQRQRIQEQQLRKQYLIQQSQQRKKQMKKQREELEKEKLERQKNLEQQIKKLKQLRSMKLLHQQLSESWKKYEQASQKQKQRIWQQQKLRRKFNSNEIKDHEAKYLQLKKDQDKKREQTLQQSRSLKHHLPYIHSTIFQKIKKEQQEKIRIEQIKIHQKEDNSVKQKIYSKQVKELFLPKVKPINNDSLEKIDEKLSPRHRTLNIEESNKLGNTYMKAVHQKVTADQIDKLKNSLTATEEPGGSSIHYKNYLRELKAEHQKQNKQSTLEKVKATLKNNQLSSTDKLHKVKMMFEKDNGLKKSDAELIDTLKNKMKVLQQIIG